MRIVRIKLRTIMIVCICHRVSDRDIAHAARGGCASFDELQDELRVGLGCGACHECARDTFDAHSTQHSGQAPRTRVVPIVWAGAPA
jgi:bacterioferritin-associated ferredoxin